MNSESVQDETYDPEATFHSGIILWMLSVEHKEAKKKKKSLKVAIAIDVKSLPLFCAFV